MRLVTFCLMIAIICFPAQAANLSGLEQGGAHVVQSVVDGDTVVLESGKQVRFVGIQAPKLPLGRKGFKKWPLADEAKAHLEKKALGKTVTLHFGGARQDRHGRILAHLITEDGLWLQGEMLKNGLARVYTFPDNRAVVPDLLAAEREARTNNRGIWAHPFYRRLTPDALGKYRGTFQLIEGKVLDAAKVRRTHYLNFGADWRTDFTVKIDKRALKAFESSDIDPLSYEGKHIRVRGWLKHRNGPMIEATHPEQIEVLE